MGKTEFSSTAKNITNSVSWVRNTEKKCLNLQYRPREQSDHGLQSAIRQTNIEQVICQGAELQIRRGFFLKYLKKLGTLLKVPYCYYAIRNQFAHIYHSYLRTVNVCKLISLR